MTNLSWPIKWKQIVKFGDLKINIIYLLSTDCQTNPSTLIELAKKETAPLVQFLLTSGCKYIPDCRLDRSYDCLIIILAQLQILSAHKINLKHPASIFSHGVWYCSSKAGLASVYGWKQTECGNHFIKGHQWIEEWVPGYCKASHPGWYLVWWFRISWDVSQVCPVTHS